MTSNDATGHDDETERLAPVRSSTRRATPALRFTGEDDELQPRPPSAEAARRARAAAAAEAARRRLAAGTTERRRRVADTSDPRAIPPTNPTILRPARRHAGAPEDTEEESATGRRLWPRALALVVLAAVIAGAVVLIGLGGRSTHSHRPRSAVAKPRAPVRHAAARPAQPTYRGAVYSARYPRGWRVVEKDVSINGAYTETRFVNPRGTAEIDIDRSTTGPLTPEAIAGGIMRASEAEAGYHELSFAATTLAGRPAWEWVFTSPAGGRITLAGYHVDLFRTIGSGRYATLGVGAHRAVVERQARAVAASITAR